MSLFTRFSLNSITLLLLATSFIFIITPQNAQAESRIGVLEIRKRRVPVYKKASFDSRIIAYAKKGKKLYGTKKTRPGIEGFGLFHKVKLRKGLFGFILDTDVVGFKKDVKKKSRLGRSSKLKSGGSRKSRLSRSRKSKKKRSSSRDENSSKKSASNETKMSKWKGYPLSFVKAYGLTYGVVDYTIEFGGVDLSSNESGFGFKLSGPGWLFKTMPIDLTLFAHLGGVEGLNTVSQNESSGMFILSDLTFPFRLKHSNNWSIYGGVGLLLNYADLEFRLNDEDKGFSGLSVGAVGTLGFVYSYQDWLFKVEPKFYWEGSQFFGTMFSIQRVL